VKSGEPVKSQDISSPSWSGDDGEAGGCILRGRRGEYELRGEKRKG
jgi:hypothetical protein